MSDIPSCIDGHLRMVETNGISCIVILDGCETIFNAAYEIKALRSSQKQQQQQQKKS